jgi:hypothetical protein
VEPSQFVSAYYGVHFYAPDWLLLTGERPEDGQFMGIPHGGKGSWWLRRQADGAYAFTGPSRANGNIWTSCRMRGAMWLSRAGIIFEVQPPGADGKEAVVGHRFTDPDMESAGTACDTRTGTAYASDLFAGRLIELAPGAEPRRRPDVLSDRAGIMFVRDLDGLLVMFDLQDLLVYSLKDARVIQKTAAAELSTSFALCQRDGTAAVPDLAGRLRVFRMTSDGTYEFAWGLPLFAPRFAAYSPDCSFLAITSADDRHVSVIDTGRRAIVRTFQLGPTIRAATFTGPREIAVADACTVTQLSF